MSEQIEVLGQFDVRRDIVHTDNETKAPGKMARMMSAQSKKLEESN